MAIPTVHAVDPAESVSASHWAAGESATVPGIPPWNGETVTQISKQALFFSQLQQLSAQDPSQFRAVAAGLAVTFQSAAGRTSGSPADELASVAMQLSAAAKSGALAPKPGVPTPRMSSSDAEEVFGSTLSAIGQALAASSSRAVASTE